MGLTRYEQETTITWNAGEGTAHIYSATPTTIRRLDGLVETYPDTYRCTWAEADGSAKRYEVEKRRIRFCKPPSEARKEAGRKNIARMRSTLK